MALTAPSYGNHGPFLEGEWGTDGADSVFFASAAHADLPASIAAAMAYQPHALERGFFPPPKMTVRPLPVALRVSCNAGGQQTWGGDMVSHCNAEPPPPWNISKRIRSRWACMRHLQQRHSSPGLYAHTVIFLCRRHFGYRPITRGEGVGVFSHAGRPMAVALAWSAQCLAPKPFASLRGRA